MTASIAPSGNLRVVTLNLWGTEPPLEHRLQLAARQLAALAPDVVCLQEVRPLDGRGGRTTADVLAEALGKRAHYEVAVAWEDGVHGKLPAGQEGLAVIASSIREARVLALPEPRPADARILLSAQIDTAGGPIWVHTTHLHYRLDDGVAREHQVLAIDEAIRGFGRANDSAPQILCGDFNATADSDELRFLRGLTTLGGRRTHFQDAWLRLHREPGPGDGPAQGITWSSENRLTRALRSLDLDRRIDYVLVTTRKKDGRGTVHDCRVVLTEREPAAEVEIEFEIAASDHYAVCADIQVVAAP
ncbi:MAG TPA: endonuclease/exonuclease/phosphatase family protein [Kofleriaceae bacterium]|jgi:endonuclease/exonuclease/phosphatase family metal-dependent hydrolase|nr:endonuclease/exonuclease/phosphatase family protein [Kofleriaceae bacterium]